MEPYTPNWILWRHCWDVDAWRSVLTQQGSESFPLSNMTPPNPKKRPLPSASSSEVSSSSNKNRTSVRLDALYSRIESILDIIHPPVNDNMGANNSKTRSSTGDSPDSASIPQAETPLTFPSEIQSWTAEEVGSYFQKLGAKSATVESLIVAGIDGSVFWLILHDDEICQDFNKSFFDSEKAVWYRFVAAKKAKLQNIFA